MMGIPKSTLFGRASDEVARILQGRIVDGSMSPGSKVDIEAITAEFGISRTPVREAVLQLEGLGLVERIPYKGAIVSAVDPARYGEVTALRIELEGLAAGLGAKRLRPEQIAEMREILGEIEKRGGEEDFSLGLFNELNRRFHSILIEASGSPVLIRMVDEMGAEADRARLHSRFDHTSTAAQHQSILEACERGDAAAARDAMRRHIYEAYTLSVDPDGPTANLLGEVIAETGIDLQRKTHA